MAQKLHYVFLLNRIYITLTPKSKFYFMKQFNAFKTFLLVALLAATSNVQGQNRHPRAFGTYGGAYANSNYYKDYVGLNVLTTAPSSLAGIVLSTFAGSGTTPWGGTVTTPLVNVPVVMPPLSDSCGCGSLTPGSMTGKIALIWRGPIGAPCEFGYKANQARIAGAVACIIINEYPNEGPVGMAAGASGGAVTIPVFQIGNIPGSALDAAYDAGTPITMTISPWGVDTNNDLGFVPGGTAAWHAYAVPYDQLTATSPSPYLGLDGAFVANYGKNDATNVKVAATLKFNGSTVRSDTTANLPLFTGTSHLPTPDSIWSMFAPNTYNVSATSPGRFDLTYSILSDSTDQNPADNVVTNTFYASDSVYSKGTYDFVNNVPLSSFATGPVSGGSPIDFVWGNMYFVNKGGGAAFSSVQYSAAFNTAGSSGAIDVGTTPILIFKWVDGANGQPVDGVVEDGELNIVANGSYAYNGTTDTSGVVFKLIPPGFVETSGAHGLADSDGTYRGPILLQDATWYYVAVNLPSTLSLECDGQSDPYPRVYGRFYHPGDTTFDYSSLVYDGTPVTPSFTLSTTPNAGQLPVPFAGVNLLGSVDSINYNQMKGLIPSVALIVNKTPTYNHVGVKEVTGNADLSVYPNPTTDNLTVSLSLENRAKKVTYSILDGLARFVSKEEHTNVLNEKTVLSTSKLATGSYFLIVNIDGRVMTRKFTVIK